MSETDAQRRTLVLFSGGKDSFITACRLLSKGDYVGLISFNNGALAAEKNLLHGATRLVNRYGEDRVHYEGVYNTAATIALLSKWYNKANYAVIKANIPNLTPPQVTCLHCQTAMWVAAIAYALSHKFSTVCAGYLSTDCFCTGSNVYTQFIGNLGRSYGVEVKFPIWYADSGREDWETTRSMEMLQHNFEPAVLEPKCLLGMPADKLTEGAETDLGNYYSGFLKAVAHSQVLNLERIFESITLSSTSMDAIEYPLPKPDGGLY